LEKEERKEKINLVLTNGRGIISVGVLLGLGAKKRQRSSQKLGDG